MNIKTLSKKALISFGLGGAFIVGSIVFAAATIPVACSTPGTCSDISSTFQAVVSKTSMKFLDSDASNFVSLKAPTNITADVNLILPATVGSDGEVLVTDGAGNLSWKASLINDNSNSGWMDIGDMRIQWGKITRVHGNWASYTVNYPVLFKSGTTPSVTVSITDSVNTGKMGTTLAAVRNNNFVYWSYILQGGNSNNSTLNWQAIGLKP